MDLLKDLGLKEVASIIQTLGTHTDVKELEGSVVVDGVECKYFKNGNSFTVYTSDGNRMCVAIDASVKEVRNSNGEGVYRNIGKSLTSTDEDEKPFERVVKYASHDVLLDYSISDGSYLVLTGGLSLPEGYEGFENVQRHDLRDALNIRYYNQDGQREASFSLGLGRIVLDDTKTSYEFEEDGIHIGNRVITLDGGTLVSISGDPTPSKSTVDSFSLEKEQKKIDELVKNKDLHEFTKARLEEAKRKLTMDDRYAKNVLSFYNTDVPEVRRAIAIRSKIIDSLEKGFVGEKELEAVSKDFSKKIKGVVPVKRP